jgi:hypothetical protein
VSKRNTLAFLGLFSQCMAEVPTRSVIAGLLQLFQQQVFRNPTIHEVTKWPRTTHCLFPKPQGAHLGTIRKMHAKIGGFGAKKIQRLPYSLYATVIKEFAVRCFIAHIVPIILEEYIFSIVQSVTVGNLCCSML